MKGKTNIAAMIQSQFRTTAKGDAFMPEIRDSFRDRAWSSICFEGDGGQPTQTPAPAPTQTPAPAPTQTPAPAPTQTLSPEQVQAALMAMLKGNQPKGDDYANHIKAGQDEEKRKAEQNQIAEAIKFNSSFADVLAKNAALFPDRTKNLLGREYESDTAKAEHVQKFAAKDFFSKPENLALLSASDKLLVEQNLIGDHNEIKMKGAEAWRLVESALHVHGIKQDQLKKQGLYSGDNNLQNPQNVQAYHDKMYIKGTTAI